MDTDVSAGIIQPVSEKRQCALSRLAYWKLAIWKAYYGILKTVVSVRLYKRRFRGIEVLREHTVPSEQPTACFRNGILVHHAGQTITAKDVSKAME